MTTDPSGGHVDILLVEDNPGDVRLTREAFDATPVDTELHVVTTGAEARSYVHREGEYADAPHPELVLLDLNLSGTDGLSVVESIKTDPELLAIPVIVLTSSEAESDVVRSYQQQASAYLTKPVDPEAFLEMVHVLADFWIRLVRLPRPED